VKELQLENAPSSMIFTELGIKMEEREEQEVKA